MNETSIQLSGLEVALSGAVPDDEDLRAHGWSELDIRFAVVALAERLLEAGADIVHGNHPTYRPLVEGVARSFAPQRRVTIVTSAYYFEQPDDETAFLLRHEPYAKVIVTAARQTKEESLTLLREQLVRISDAIVCIGGRLHRGMGTPGVEEEVRIALREGRAAFLLGSFGGFAQTMYRREFAHTPMRLNNCLDEDDNRRLATAPDPAAAMAIVLEGLRRLAARRTIPLP